jgi:hypothetical protein
MATETTALTVFDKIENPIEACQKMGEWISKSGMFGCEKIEQGMVLAMASLAERRPITDICRKYHIMDGKLSMKSEAMLAEFNQNSGTHFWEKSDDKEAVIVLTKGQFKNFKVSYSIKDAERAGLCGKDGARRQNQNKDGGWQKNPDAMLRARATSKGIRMVDPSVVVGIYTPEEIVDMRLTHDGTVVEPVQLLAPPPPPPPQPATVPPVPEEKPLPPIEELKDRLAGIEAESKRWLVAQGWLKEEQELWDLDEKHVKQILSRPREFSIAVKAFAKDSK